MTSEYIIDFASYIYKDVLYCHKYTTPKFSENTSFCFNLKYLQLKKETSTLYLKTETGTLYLKTETGTLYMKTETGSLLEDRKR